MKFIGIRVKTLVWVCLELLDMASSGISRKKQYAKAISRVAVRFSILIKKFTDFIKMSVMYNAIYFVLNNVKTVRFS